MYHLIMKNKKMKKITYVAALVLAFGLAACGGQKKQNAEAAAEAASWSI